MHYVDEGNGPPVLFVHGVPTWSFNFRHLITALSPAHRCVAMDHLGFGLSDKPVGWDYAPAALGRNVSRLVEALDLRDLTLVVHDWGGPIGFAGALERPGNVSRLILFNTWLWSSTADLRARFTAAMLASPLYRHLELRYNFTARFFVPNVMGSRSALTPEVHGQYIAPLAEARDRAGVCALAREIRDSGPWLDGLWDRMGPLAGVPALVVWGLADKAFRRKDLERWQGRLSAARVEAMPGVGHFPHEEAPREVLDLVQRFLT